MKTFYVPWVQSFVHLFFRNAYICCSSCRNLQICFGISFITILLYFIFSPFQNFFCIAKCFFCFPVLQIQFIRISCLSCIHIQDVRIIIKFFFYVNIVFHLAQQERQIMLFRQASRQIQRYNKRLDGFFCSMSGSSLSYLIPSSKV